MVERQRADRPQQFAFARRVDSVGDQGERFMRVDQQITPINNALAALFIFSLCSNAIAK